MCIYGVLLLRKKRLHSGQASCNHYPGPSHTLFRLNTHSNPQFVGEAQKASGPSPGMVHGVRELDPKGRGLTTELSGTGVAARAGQRRRLHSDGVWRHTEGRGGRASDRVHWCRSSWRGAGTAGGGQAQRPACLPCGGSCLSSAACSPRGVPQEHAPPEETNHKGLSASLLCPWCLAGHSVVSVDRE